MEVIALILLPVAVLMCAYALTVFIWRSRAISKKTVRPHAARCLPRWSYSAARCRWLVCVHFGSLSSRLVWYTCFQLITCLPVVLLTFLPMPALQSAGWQASRTGERARRLAPDAQLCERLRVCSVLEQGASPLLGGAGTPAEGGQALPQHAALRPSAAGRACIIHKFKS